MSTDEEDSVVIQAHPEAAEWAYETLGRVGRETGWGAEFDVFVEGNEEGRVQVRISSEMAEVFERMVPALQEAGLVGDGPREMILGDANCILMELAIPGFPIVLLTTREKRRRAREIIDRFRIDGDDGSSDEIFALADARWEETFRERGLS